MSADEKKLPLPPPPKPIPEGEPLASVREKARAEAYKDRAHAARDAAQLVATIDSLTDVAPTLH